MRSPFPCRVADCPSASPAHLLCFLATSVSVTSHADASLFTGTTRRGGEGPFLSGTLSRASPSPSELSLESDSVGLKGS